MGEALYAGGGEHFGRFRLRVYAPVGGHEDLLPYLVRRLLENGANTSFVHLLLDDETPPEKVARDPIARSRSQRRRAHIRAFPCPAIFMATGATAQGVDLSIARTRQALDGALSHAGVGPETAAAMPAKAEIDAAFAAAKPAQPAWDGAGGAARAAILRAMADALEAASRPADRALRRARPARRWPTPSAEVREAADFCRYYALLAERQFAAPRL